MTLKLPYVIAALQQSTLTLVELGKPVEIKEGNESSNKSTTGLLLTSITEISGLNDVQTCSEAWSVPKRFQNVVFKSVFYRLVVFSVQTKPVSLFILFKFLTFYVLELLKIEFLVMNVMQVK